MESWKIIEGFENYSVSDHGNVKNNKTGRIMKTRFNHEGYIIIDIRVNKQRYTKRVHILMAIAFITNPDGKSCVDHIDNDKSNNKSSNLRWATHSQNGQNKSMMSNNTSGVKGVFWDKTKNKYQSYINIDGVRIHLGTFTNIEDAKQARMIKANALYGVFTHSGEKII
jgi:hypothetical protein